MIHALLLFQKSVVVLDITFLDNVFHQFSSSIERKYFKKASNINPLFMYVIPSLII